MDRNSKRIIIISVFFLIFGGFGALVTMWENVFQILVTFFPFICEAGKMALEEYLTSPYFIVGVIMAISSAFGIWFGVRGGRMLFLMVSLICEIVSLTSIFSNVI